jgi:hypothetical protein
MHKGIIWLEAGTNDVPFSAWIWIFGFHIIQTACRLATPDWSCSLDWISSHLSSTPLLCIVTAFQYAPKTVATAEGFGLCLGTARLPSLTASRQSCCCRRLVPELKQNAFQKWEADSLLPGIPHCYWHCCLRAEKWRSFRLNERKDWSRPTVQK